MTPIRLRGTFMAAKKALDRKKQPIGTLAFPSAARVAIKIHNTSSYGAKVMPFSIDTKSTVVRINAAQPFMLMLVQRGKAKLTTLRCSPARSSAQRTADGTVALEDLVKKATVNAGNIAFASSLGEIPFSFNKRGKTTKPCNRFAESTAAR